jgi:hypothetical protein
MTRIIQYPHYPGSRMMTSAVIWQYRDMIRVAGLWLMSWWQKSLSRYPDIMGVLYNMTTSHNPATQITSLYCHMTAEVVIQLPGCWTTTSAVIWQYRDMIRVSGLRLLPSYYTIHPLSYPDHVSILSYDGRSHHPATWYCSNYKFYVSVNGLDSLVNLLIFSDYPFIYFCQFSYKDEGYIHKWF